MTQQIYYKGEQVDEKRYFCTMIFSDTHTHIYLDAFDTDRAAMLQRAEAAGVKYLFLPDIDKKSRRKMLEVAAEHAAMCFPMAGLHPTSVGADYREQLALSRDLLDTKTVVGIGECGIDMYWDQTHVAAQKEVFVSQLEWSLETGLPVSIHIRDAFNEVFEVLTQFGNTRFKGVFHCFTGGLEEAERAIGYGFHLGIGGIITFKKSPLPQVIKHIDPGHIVLESDAPFLAPSPYRGKRNEPAWIPFVAEKLAETWGVSLQNVAEATTHNALQLFKPESI